MSKILKVNDEEGGEGDGKSSASTKVSSSKPNDKELLKKTGEIYRKYAEQIGELQKIQESVSSHYDEVLEKKIETEGQAEINQIRLSINKEK